MTPLPRVSVVVPNYNHARFLNKRIQSVLEQTYQDFELLLLDDASTDESVRILEQYRGNPRVKIFINESNSGSPFPQWNRGVELACGEYVWIAEADDDAAPSLLETLVGKLDVNPTAVCAYCQSWVIDENGERLRTADCWTDHLDAQHWQRDFLVDGTKEARDYLIFQCTIPNASAVLFRRSAFMQVGGAPTDMRLSGDWMLWASLASRGMISFTAAPLNYFRQHDSTVRSSTPSLRRVREAFEVTAKVGASVGITDGIRQKLADRILKEWISACWHEPQPIQFALARRVGSFLWRLSRSAAARFFIFIVLRRALGSSAIGPAQQLWRAYKRLRPAGHGGRGDNTAGYTS